MVESKKNVWNNHQMCVYVLMFLLNFSRFFCLFHVHHDRIGWVFEWKIMTIINANSHNRANDMWSYFMHNLNSKTTNCDFGSCLPFSQITTNASVIIIYRRNPRSIHEMHWYECKPVTISYYFFLLISLSLQNETVRTCISINADTCTQRHIRFAVAERVFYCI